MTSASKPRSKLTDRDVETAIDFGEGARVLRDNVVQGLRIRIGRTRRTWFFFREYQIKGNRGTAWKRLGFWPGMNIEQARRAALQEAARVASRRPQPGRRQAITVEQAAADYLSSLETRGKKSAYRVAGLIRLHLLPEFGRFTLAELSDAPALVRDWHSKISAGKPVSANRIASVLSAIYRHASRLDRSLPPASPISGIRMNKENPKQNALPFDQYGEWHRIVSALPALRQGYYKLLLYTGMRGAEAQGLRWSDINLRSRTITLRGTKTGKDVSIPMTAAIAACLKLAWSPARDGDEVVPIDTTSPPESPARDGDLIFPGARHWADDLPAKGHALRHSFLNVGHDLGLNEIHLRLLVGHSLSGVHASYLTRMVMEGGEGLKSSQRKISRRISELMR